MAFLTLPIIVFTQVNSSFVTLWCPPPVTILSCKQPAFFTAEKQAKPSETTKLPDCTCCCAHFAISVSRKPFTTVMLIAIGWPSSLVDIATTYGTLFSDPLPLDPPCLSPPQ